MPNDNLQLPTKRKKKKQLKDPTNPLVKTESESVSDRARDGLGIVHVLRLEKEVVGWEKNLRAGAALSIQYGVSSANGIRINNTIILQVAPEIYR